MRSLFSIPITFLAAIGVALGGSAGAQDVEHGRVSFADESALIKGDDTDEWAFAAMNALVLPGDTIWADESGAIEVEFTNGVFLRLADGSRVDVVEVPPDALFRGWTGSIYVQRLSRSTGSVTFDTPVGSIHLFPDSQVRIDIVEGGATTVSVRWGQVAVDSEVGDTIEVGAGQRVYIDPGYLPSEPVAFERSREDEFDSWNRDRARTIALGATSPIGVDAANSTTLGVHDLNQYGEWIRVDDETYWKPTVVVDYVPYRSGSWSYVPAHGYVWVGHHPFSYITTHHGYWDYHHHHGWIWRYHRPYSPAYAYTIHYGDRFIWAPLGHHGHPVTHHSFAGFHLGDIHFSFAFTSFGHHHHVRHGFHSVHRLHHHHIFDHHGDFRHHDFDHWRIEADDSRFRNAGRPHAPEGRSRHFEPEVVARGPLTRGDGQVAARDRAQALASRQGRNEFAPSRPTSRVATTRTTPRASDASVREARVQMAGRDRGSVRGPGSSARPSVPQARARSRTLTNDDARGVDIIGRGGATGGERSRATSTRRTVPDRATADGRRTVTPDRPDTRSRPDRSTRPEVIRPDSRTTNPPSTRDARTSRPESTNRPSITRPDTTRRPTVTRPNSDRGSSVRRPDATARDSRPSISRPSRTEGPSVTRPDINRRESVSRPSTVNRPSLNRPTPDRSRGSVTRPSPSSRGTVNRSPSRSSRPSINRERSSGRSSITRPSPGASSRGSVTRRSPSVSRPSTPSRSFSSPRSSSPSRSSISRPSSPSRSFGSSRGSSPSRSSISRPSSRGSSIGSRGGSSRSSISRPSSPSRSSGSSRGGTSSRGGATRPRGR